MNVYQNELICLEYHPKYNSDLKSKMMYIPEFGVETHKKKK